MGLYRRPDSAVWWFSITVKGQRFRESTGTTDRPLAARIERRRRAELRRQNRQVTAARLRVCLYHLGLSPADAARFLDHDPRTVRRWLAGEEPVPAPEAMLFALMMAANMEPEDARAAAGLPPINTKPRWR